jgi:phosphoribosylaminoimidazole (AIR) synthetase
MNYTVERNRHNTGRKPGAFNRGHVGFTPAEHDAVIRFKILNQLTFKTMADAVHVKKHKMEAYVNYGAGMTLLTKAAIMELCEVQNV